MIENVTTFSAERAISIVSKGKTDHLTFTTYRKKGGDSIQITNENVYPYWWYRCRLRRTI